ncbi:MAG: hypothetical protein JXR64_12920, partial [Spirochaetales bacterium]|nr:hypothetical protein [Spirochaetales bacterium]
MKKRYILLFPFVCLVLFILISCNLPAPINDVYDPDMPDFNKPGDYEKLMFPEKRRTRSIGFDQNNSLNDFDGDGIVNAKDAYPLDKNYPGIYLESINVPLIVTYSKNFENDLECIGPLVNENEGFNIGTLSINFDDWNFIDMLSNLKQAEYYPNRITIGSPSYTLTEGSWAGSWFGKDTANGKLEPRWFKFDTGQNEYYNIYWWDSDINENYAAVRISIFNQYGSEYWIEDATSENSGVLLRIPNSQELYIRVEPVDPYSSRTSFKLKIAAPSFSLLGLNAAAYLNKNFTLDNEIDTNLIWDDLKINIVSLKNNDDRQYKTLPDLYEDTNLSKQSIVSLSSMFKIFSDSDYGSENMLQIAYDIYEIVTGKEVEHFSDLGAIFEYSSDGETHLLFTPNDLKDNWHDGLNIANKWGFPGSGPFDTDKWDYLSNETLIFSTLKDSHSVEEIRWTGLDNTIYYNPISDNIENNTPPIDKEYKMSFNNGLNLNQSIAVKLVITKAKDDFYVRIFVSGQIPANFSKQFNSEYVKFLNLTDSGFTTSDTEIIYNPTNDKGQFWNYMYSLLSKESSKEDIEAYTYFLFLTPTKTGQWCLTGSTAHFWPIKSRVTMVAKLDKDNNVIEGPLNIPYEYLVSPTKFIDDSYIKKLYDSRDQLKYNNLFHINAQKNEKLLYSQGVIMQNSKNPLVDTSGVAFFPNETDKRMLNTPSNPAACRNIDVSAIPASHANPTILKANQIARAFINNENADGHLYSNAY